MWLTRQNDLGLSFNKAADPVQKRTSQVVRFQQAGIVDGWEGQQEPSKTAGEMRGQSIDKILIRNGRRKGKADG